MQLRKVGEFYTENKGCDEYKIRKALEEVGYHICWLEDYCDGNRYVIMEDIENGTNR